MIQAAIILIVSIFLLPSKPFLPFALYLFSHSFQVL